MIAVAVSNNDVGVCFFTFPENMWECVFSRVPKMRACVFSRTQKMWGCGIFTYPENVGVWPFYACPLLIPKATTLYSLY
jgi:hypothetical protein